ncbi:MAG: Ig-like domain-containing domain [Planctomycetota bacterium]
MKGLWTCARMYGPAFGLLALATVVGCGDTETPASADPQEIALIRMEPGDGESSVPRNRTVRMIFNVRVNPASVHDQSILVRTGGTFQTRPEGTFLINGNVVEFDPTVTSAGGANAAGFPAGGQILVEVRLKIEGDGLPANLFVQNEEGNPITVASGDNLLAFTTGAGWDDPVPGPPGVLGLEFVPGPNAVGQVPSSAAVTVIFSEPIDPSSVILGKNLFLTNNTGTSPIFQQDIPSITFFDGSLTRYTFQPVFGFGQGPFNVLVNFIDPDDPVSFDPDDLPRDLGGNRVQNFTFFQTFDTQFDPTTVNTGLLREDFTDFSQRDAANTDALWGDDSEFPFELVGQPITTRIVPIGVAEFAVISGGSSVIDNPQTTPIASPRYVGTDGLIYRPQDLSAIPPPPNPPFPPPDTSMGEEDYCPTQNPLVGVDSIILLGNPPSSSGRRQLNLYRQAELGANGTIIRVAWGPDSDATFAATYPELIMRLGHKKEGTSISVGSFFAQFDVEGFVTVVDKVDYTVPQAANTGGGLINDHFLDWPSLERFFEYDGVNDVLVDIEAKEGNTFQTFRTYLALDRVFGVCSCANYGGCAVNNTIGQRQADSTYGGDFLNPAPAFGVANPAPFIHAMEFELAKLRSDAQSIYYDSKTPEPDFLTPILNPLVQAAGATIAMSYSGSIDGIIEDVPFTPNVDDVDTFQYIRFHVVMRSNLFTGGRPRLALLEIPFTFE